jgi:hypothetical protein
MLPERAFKKSLFKNAPATLEGGGSSPPPAPSKSEVTNTNIPEYARPYVENMLGATQQQLFNTTQNADGTMQITGIKPYVPYSQNPQDYFAGFSPLQQQTQQNVANMQLPGQFNQGSALTGMSGLGSYNAGQNFQNMATNPNAVGAYMNPYIQNALQPQLEEMQRQYGITGTQQQSQATKSGAFGGGREAIMAAENQRNKNMAMNQAIGQGYNTAFNNAQQQMNMGAQLGLQGYGQAGQAGASLANIGGQGLQAQQSIYGLQNQVGAQQQAAQQDIINQGIQNYAVAQQYPQQQLSFMNAMLRGLPMQAGTTQMYQAQPSAISQAAGLGTAGIAGLGLYNTMSGGRKAGGVIKSYAEGGIADIDRKVLLSPDKYSVQQIRNGMQNGVINKLVGNPVLADKIKEHQMANAPQPQEQQPTIAQQINQQAAQLSQAAPAPLPLPLPQQQGLPDARSNLPTFNAFDGGIVAFGGGGDIKRFASGGLDGIPSLEEQIKNIQDLKKAEEERYKRLPKPKTVTPFTANQANTPSFLLQAAAPAVAPPVSGAQQVYATGQNITPPAPAAPPAASPSFGQRISGGIDSLRNMFSSGEKTSSPAQTSPKYGQMTDVKNMVNTRSNPAFRLGASADSNVYPGASDPAYLRDLKAALEKDPTYQPYIDEIAKIERKNQNSTTQQNTPFVVDDSVGENVKVNPPMTVIRDNKKNAGPSAAVNPKAPVVAKEEAAPVASESSGLDFFTEQAKGLKSSQDELKQLILGQGENSDKQLKINSLLALANAGFGMAGGTSPNAITNIAAGGAKGIEGLAQAVGQNEAAKARQVQQLVALGLKGQELNAELQKLGITKNFYDAHADLYRAQVKLLPYDIAYKQAQTARALRPPSVGGGIASGMLTPGKINATEQLKINEYFSNMATNPQFIASLDPAIQAQLKTKPGSPSYNAGMGNVNKIIESKQREFEAGIRKSNATYKVPQASFFSEE